jgi:dienelactone hydrolase
MTQPPMIQPTTTPTATPPAPRGRTRVALVALAALLLGGTGAVLWLTRNPVPHFEARHDSLAGITERAGTVDGTTFEHEVQVRATSGLTIELAIRRPAGVEPDTAIVRRPLFLVLGGHERGKGAAALIGDTRGAIFASLEYPFDGDHKAKGLAVVAQVPAIRRALFDIPPAVSLALDYLLARPDVDPTRVELVGASFGAPFATIAAARDTRVTRLWLAHGGGDTYAMIARGLEKDIPFMPARVPVAVLANVLANGPRFTPEKWIGRVAPRPVVMLNAEEDEKIPRRSVEVLYAAAGDPKELVWLPGQHMQGNRPEVIERLIAAVMERAVLPGE